MNRLIQSWVYGGFLSGVLLLILSPVICQGWPWPAILAFLHLPTYMVHQYEEHDRDRFRIFFNQTIGKGRDVLSSESVFVTNVFGVWGIIALSFFLSRTVDAGFALLAVYLVLVNAWVHIVHGFLFKSYNPGLATAILLFIPLGIYSLTQITPDHFSSWSLHILSFVNAVGIHVGILIHVKRKYARA